MRVHRSASIVAAFALGRLASGCPAPSAPPAAFDENEVRGATASTLQALAQSPDGTYFADAVVVGVETCHCPSFAKCDCAPDAVTVTNDIADGASWTLRIVGGNDVERRFPKGTRVRLVVRVWHGRPSVVGILARQ